MKRLIMSLKTKMTIGVCLVVSGITAAMAFYSLSLFQQQLKENVAAQQFVLLTSIAEHIDDILVDAQHELVKMAKSLPLDCLTDAGRAQRFLDDRGSSETTFDNSIVLLSRKGTLIAETPFDPGRRGKDFSFRDYFKKTIATGKPCISEPFLSAKQHRHPVIVFTAPLFGPSGQATGVLAGSIDLTQHNFLRNIAHINIGKSGYLFLFNSDRTVIMHPDEKRILARDVPVGVNKSFDKAVAGFEGTEETVNSKGLPVLVSYKRLTATNWILAANFPQAEAYAAIGRTKQYMIAALLATIVLSVSVVWFLMDRMTAPLQRFAFHVRSISGKRGTERLFDNNGGDEIGVLAEAFNGMVIELDNEQEALRRNEDLLTEAQRMARVGNWELDVRSGRITWSEEMYRITGLDRDTFDGTSKTFFDLVHPDEREAVERAAQSAMQGGNPFVVEHRFVQPNGMVRTVRSVAEVSFDQDKGPVRVFGTVMDISERKGMEDELHKAKVAAEEYAQRLYFALEGSNDATWEWDVIADQGILNARYYEMLEYLPGEVDINLAFFMKTIHPDDDAEVNKKLAEHLEGKTGMYEAEYRMVTRSGKIRQVMGRGKVVMRDGDGRPTKMAGVVTDITELKRLNDEVNRMHNLESIGLLAGGLAHDFNNVLNIIYGNISFAKMLAGGDTAIAEPLTDAEEACERAKELGIRLQALSHGSSPVKEPIALPAILEDAVGTLFNGSNISHTISTSDGLFPVEADPRQIRQVFANLLTNAKEAISNGGTVKISIENCTVDANNGIPLGSGLYVCIAFQDDGKGIPEENLSKIFDPYYSTKDTYSQKGMGLGLSISHTIMKRHRGHICVDSTLGTGTRVTVYLPAAVEESTHTPEGLP